MLSTSKSFFRKPGGAAAATDASFAYVPLLLNTGSTNGQQNNTFLDSSTNNFTITRNGTPTQGSRTPYWPNGQWSNYFAASGDYISVPDAANLELGASDFQMSAWIYLTAYPVSNLGDYASAILSKGTFAGTRSYGFTINGSSATSLTVGLTNAGGTTTNITGSFSFALNTWYAVRATRVSNRVYLFVNGTLLNAGGTAYTDTVSNGTDTLKVGRANLDVNYVFQLFGYVSNVSLAIGGTGYSTASYTPATTPTTATSDIKFLSCQSNRFVDNSSVPAVVTVTGTPTVQAFQPFSPAASYSAATYAGSGFFNGSTDSLSIASNAAFGFGTGDYTIEGWVYLPNSATGSTQELVDIRPTAGASPIAVGVNPTGFPFAYNGTTYASSIAASSSAWNHIAVVRNGSGTNNCKIYVNGVQGVQFTDTSNYGTANPCVIGKNVTGSSDYLNGYASNVRLVKGVAIYTAAFTPPTTPVTNTAQTSLLLNMANAGIYDAAAQNDITTVGDAQVSTTITPKWPPSSIKFDGTGDYLSVSAGSPQSLTFGTGNFTIEFWVYFTSNTGFQTLYDGRAAAGAYPLLYLNNGVINYYVGASAVITSVQPSTGVWIFMSLRRSSGTTQFFINGTQSGGSYADSNNYLAPPTSGARVGANFAGSDFLFGYIQDFRVTKAARAATPIPTAAFPTR
jgi:hypothetical protein